MGRKFTFVGLVQSATAGNAPRFIKLGNEVYRWNGHEYVFTRATDWTLIEELMDRREAITFESMNNDYLFETLDVVELKKDEKRILESFIRLASDYIHCNCITKTRYCTDNFYWIEFHVTRNGIDDVEKILVDSKYFQNMELNRGYSDVELNLFEEDYD